MHPDLVAQTVLEAYKRIPGKGKPHVRSNGKLEWTVLAGIVVKIEHEEPVCVALATGLKALPDAQLSKSNGSVLHDMHAEIMSIRALNVYLLDECTKALDNKSSVVEQLPDNSAWSRRFSIREGVEFHLYVSEPPCGDASLAALANAADEVWSSPVEHIGSGGVVRGRAHFFHSGLVRTKPGRRDSPVTLSKSCTDKLTLRQTVSLLSGPVAKVLSPHNAYLSSLVLPSFYSEDDTTRAFQQRLETMPCTTSYGPYRPKLFKVVGTNEQFESAKHSDHMPCPNGIAYVLNRPPEAILGGVKMGAKPFTGKGTSMLSRRSIVQSVRDLAASIQLDLPQRYGELKYDSDRDCMKQELYRTLGGWISTSPDDFEL